MASDSFGQCSDPLHDCFIQETWACLVFCQFLGISEDLDDRTIVAT